MQLVRPEVRKIEIPAVEWTSVDIMIVGLTPLIINNFDSKTLQEIEDAQGGEARQRRSPKIIKDCFERARIRDEKGNDCICALWIKCAAVDAARYVQGITMTELRGGLRVIGDLLPIKYKSMRMRRDPVRLKGGGADLRYRPEYTEWSARTTVRFRENVLTLGSVINLLNNAGQCVGLGEKRPAQNGDSFGLFEVRQVTTGSGGKKRA